MPFYEKKVDDELHYESGRGNLGGVKALLEEGADVTSGDNEAVRRASHKGFLHVVKYLVEKRADITACENYSLRWASMNGHLETVKFLIENKADISAEDNFSVQGASREGHLEVVKFLVEHKADPTATNNLALYRAILNNRLEVVRYLALNGVDITLYGHRAISMASTHHDVWRNVKEKMEMVKLLLGFYKNETERTKAFKKLSDNHKEYFRVERFYKRWRQVIFRRFFRKTVIPLYYAPGFPGAETAKRELSLLTLPKTR